MLKGFEGSLGVLWVKKDLPMVPKYPEMSYLVKRVCRDPDVYKMVL